MGVNNMTYTYNFNVPVYNSAQYNYQTTFFEYNNVKSRKFTLRRGIGREMNLLSTGLITRELENVCSLMQLQTVVTALCSIVLTVLVVHARDRGRRPGYVRDYRMH